MLYRTYPACGGGDDDDGGGGLGGGGLGLGGGGDGLGGGGLGGGGGGGALYGLLTRYLCGGTSKYCSGGDSGQALSQSTGASSPAQ